MWPMDDEQKIQWRKELKEREEKAKLPPQEYVMTPERKAEIHAQAVSAALEAYARMPKKRKSEEEPTTKAAKRIKVKSENHRQTRLGQTKLIDELLKAGKSDKEVFDAVREKIPTYPADKLPKLIKLRQYHIKKK